MGIKILNLNVLISTFDYASICPGDLISKSEVIEYEAENPFPETEQYDREMMMSDMQHTYDAGILTFSDDVTEEQIEWIEEFLNETI